MATLDTLQTCGLLLYQESQGSLELQRDQQDPTETKTLLALLAQLSVSYTCRSDSAIILQEAVCEELRVKKET